MRLGTGLVLLVGLWGMSLGLAAPHPFHDDNGVTNWQLSYPLALRNAQASGKLVFALGAMKKDTRSQLMATKTLQDPQVRKLIRRYFVPVIIDVEKAQANQVFAIFPKDKLGGSTLPFITLCSERGQFVAGTSGGRNPEEFLADLKKVLEGPAYALPPASEKVLAQRLLSLQRALDRKSYRQATSLYNRMTRVRGYSPSKDKAFDLMDDVQFEATRRLAEAVLLVGQNDYDGANKIIAPIPRTFAGLPVASEVKQHVVSIKVLAAVHKLVEAKKGAWQAAAVQQLDALLKTFPDGPYASLAVKRKQELLMTK